MGSACPGFRARFCSGAGLRPAPPYPFHLQQDGCKPAPLIVVVIAPAIPSSPPYISHCSDISSFGRLLRRRSRICSPTSTHTCDFARADLLARLPLATPRRASPCLDSPADVGRCGDISYTRDTFHGCGDRGRVGDRRSSSGSSSAARSSSLGIESLHLWASLRPC